MSDSTVDAVPYSSFACQTVLFSMDLLACETVLLHSSGLLIFVIM